MSQLHQQTIDDLIPEELLDCQLGYTHVFESNQPEKELWVKQTCSRPWCVQCEPIRVWRLQRKIMKYLVYHKELYKHLWIVTRSVRNTPEMVSSFNSLRSAQLKFSKQVKLGRNVNHPLRQATIWIATTEVKYDHIAGFNVHEHMIWGTETARLDFKDFHRYWDRAAEISGAHINIVKVNNSRHAANYVAKYLSKGIWGGLTPGRAYLCRDALKGRNRIQSKRGTVPPARESKFCLCCLGSADTQCSGEGTMPIGKTAPPDAPVDNAL